MIPNTIEEKTWDLLSNYGLINIPVDLESLAIKLGLKVIKSNPNDDSLSGALIRDDMSRILINSTHNEQRRRFTLGHEIGHYILHPEQSSFIDGEKKQLKVLFRSSHNKDSNIEKEANSFSAAILMPFELLRKEISAFSEKNVSLVDHLSKKFNVSKEAMGYRLLYLGYINVA